MITEVAINVPKGLIQNRIAVVSYYTTDYQSVRAKQPQLENHYLLNIFQNKNYNRHKTLH